MAGRRGIKLGGERRRIEEIEGETAKINCYLGSDRKTGNRGSILTYICIYRYSYIDIQNGVLPARYTSGTNHYLI